MNDLAQHLQLIQLRLHEEELEDLLITLQEVENLATQYPTKETYEILAYTYHALCNITTDDPDTAHDLILNRFLPWLIDPTLSESADSARGDGGKFLRQWVDQYPEDIRQDLLLLSLDVLINALQNQPTLSVCWTISYLGYRRPDVVFQLWKVINDDNGKLGNAALRALEELQVQGDDRNLLLEELHHRVEQGENNPLIGALGGLADVSTVPVIQQYLYHLSEEDIRAVVRSLALNVLADIADVHDTNSTLQSVIWKTITTLYETTPEHYAFDIHLNNEIASRCNDPDVPLHLVKWLEYYPDDSERGIYQRYLLYLRLSECVRPRQFLSTSISNLPGALVLLQRDASRDSRNKSLWATQESHSKEQAWETLLYLGDASVLSHGLFEQAVIQETSGYLRGQIMELLACFYWQHLPQQVLTWITERVDLQQETASQELPSRRGAEHLARSAATREVFEALLRFGLTFHGDVLRETADTLASVALTLLQQGVPGIIEDLLSTIEHGEEERHRTVAMQAVEWAAGNGLLPQQLISRIVLALRDEQRSDFERSRLAKILGAVSQADVTSDMIDTLRYAISSGQTQVAMSALEALAQTGGLLAMPDFLQERLHLSADGDQWNYLYATTANSWTVGMIGALYCHAPYRFAPAMATLLEHSRMFEIFPLLRTLDRVHGDKNRLVPPEIQVALLSRLVQFQNEMFNTPTQFLLTCAHLFPDALAQQMHNNEWDTWTPEMRAALAEALGEGQYSEETARKQAITHLLQLLCDAQYRVRRAACRSLATLCPDALLDVCTAWTYAASMELRRRAAEGLGWLPIVKEAWQKEIHLLQQRLIADQDSLVREVMNRAALERRQRIWANEYLVQIRRVYGQKNQERLATWRYGYALTKIGDEITLAELQKDIRQPQLVPDERQWLRWIFKNMQEHWKKTMDQWPKPWFAWSGKVIYELAHVVLNSNVPLQGICNLYQKENTDVRSQKAYWGGTFRLNTSIAVSEGEKLTLYLESGHVGQAVVVASITNETWLLEGVGSLT